MGRSSAISTMSALALVTLCPSNSFACDPNERCRGLKKYICEARKAACRHHIIPQTIKIPEVIQEDIKKIGSIVSQTAEQAVGGTLTTVKDAVGNTVRVLQTTAGYTIITIHNTGEDSLKTTFKAAGDVIATYDKAWRDTTEQSKRGFKDAIDAGKATAHYLRNQATGLGKIATNNQKRLLEGKVVDAIWGLTTEQLKTTEENFAKATQESKVINGAASTAAAAYGGPGGAAAYAAWSTYRSTGNADMAFRAGVLAAVTSQLGTSTASIPTGTAGEVLKKAAVAGASGGIAVAAAGGDEQAIKDGFLKSAGAVLIQGGPDKLKAYSPEAKDAYDAVQCISARDVDCISNMTWARDAKGKIQSSLSGNLTIDPHKLDPKEYIGRWTKFDPQSPEGKILDYTVQISKLPDMQAIPMLENKWILTWTIGKDEEIAYKSPTAVLTYAGNDPPFSFTINYGNKVDADTFAEDDDLSGYFGGDDTLNGINVIYYSKVADRHRIDNALKYNNIPYKKYKYFSEKHARALSNALICGPKISAQAFKKVAIALIESGVDIKYIGTKNSILPNKILIVTLLRDSFVVNYKNITRAQVETLSECPSELKNR